MLQNYSDQIEMQMKTNIDKLITNINIVTQNVYS